MSENYSYTSFFDESFFDPSESYAFVPEQSTVSLDEVLYDQASSDYVGPDFFVTFGENQITTSISEPDVQPQATTGSNGSVLEQPQISEMVETEATPEQQQLMLPPPSPSKKPSVGDKPKADSPIDLTSDADSPPPQQSAPAMPPVATNGLRFTSIDHARQFAEARTPLALANDDWATMEANPQPHILKIMAAFTGKLRPEPEKYDCNEIRLAEWAIYQARNLDRVNKIARLDPSRTELAAWLIFGELIDAHKHGAKPAKANTTAQPAPAPTKCSIHLDALCQPIRDYAIFRFDLLRLTRIDELVSNVEGAKTRKLSNFKGNGRKAERDVQNADRAAEMGFDYEKVLGSKRKRGEGERESDEGMKKVKKTKKKRTAAAADEKEMGFGEFAGFSGSDSFSPAEVGKGIKKVKKTKKHATAIHQGDMDLGEFGGCFGAGSFDPAAVGGASVGDIGGFSDAGLFDSAATGGAESSNVFGSVRDMSVGDIGGGVKRKACAITIE